MIKKIKFILIFLVLFSASCKSLSVDVLPEVAPTLPPATLTISPTQTPTKVAISHISLIAPTETPSPPTETVPPDLSLLAPTATARPPVFAGNLVSVTSPATSTAVPTAQSYKTIKVPPFSQPVFTNDYPMSEAVSPDPDFRISYSKIGFHTASGHAEGLREYLEILDSNGVPISIKSVDNTTGLYDLQQIIQEGSTVPHTLIYRSTLKDVPPYDKDPVTAARQQWEYHKGKFPPELDKSIVWIETTNEGNKDHTEGWWGLFAQESAALALRDGYKWAAFGWATGEPEAHHWKDPAMLEFLRMAGESPDRLAISLHEYSLKDNSLMEGYPHMLGRFQMLFSICDEADIPRPSVFITEWGWTLWDIPNQPTAMNQIAWADRMYAMYPEVLGVHLWHMGSGWKDIGIQVQKMIVPITEYATTHYWIVPKADVYIDPDLFLPDEEWTGPECRWCYQMNEVPPQAISE